MDQQTKTIMFDTLVDQQEVVKAHEYIYALDSNEAPDFTDWLNNLIETADVTVDISDFTTETGVDYNGFWRATYNQVKAYILTKVTVFCNGWISTDQTLEAS